MAIKNKQKGSGKIRNFFTKIKSFFTRKKGKFQINNSKLNTIINENSTTHKIIRKSSTSFNKPLLLKQGYKPSRENLNRSKFMQLNHNIRINNDERIKFFYYTLLFTLQNYFIEIDSFEKSNNKYIFIKYLLDEIRMQIHENTKDNKITNTDSIFENYNKLLNNDIYTKIFIDELMKIMNKINLIIQIIILHDYRLLYAIQKRYDNIKYIINQYDLGDIYENKDLDKNKYISIINNFTDIELSVIIDRSQTFIHYITKYLLMPKKNSLDLNNLNNNNRFIYKKYHKKLNNIHKEIIILYINYHVCQMKINLPLSYDKQKNNNIHRIETKNQGLFITYYQALGELIRNDENKKMFNMFDHDSKELIKEIHKKYKNFGLTQLESINSMKDIKPSSCTEIKREIKKYTKLLLTLPIFRKKSTIFHRLTRIN